MEGEWQTVNRKKDQTLHKNKEIQGRMDIAGNEAVCKEGTVSFYFSEFPDSHGAKDMLRAFAFYGKIVEVVIPPRRNKWGKRFGFARFANVQYPKVFAVKLDNIIFGANKIHVNLPRFEREKVEENKKRQDYSVKPQQLNQKVWRVAKGRGADGAVSRPMTNLANGGRNTTESRIKERWKGKDGRKGTQYHHQTDQKIVYYRKKNLCDVWYNTSGKELNNFKKMYVAEVKNDGNAHMVQELFNMQGFFFNQSNSAWSQFGSS